MGIYIPKIEKPKGCHECFAFQYEHGDWEPNVYCGITKEELYDATRVGTECPLLIRPEGHWDFAGDNMFRCTECGVLYTYSQLERLKIHTTDSAFPNYCPRCGADMRGEADDKI